MLLSEGLTKWAMRIYPPLLFQRIWVKKFDKDFLGVEVKIYKSFLNRNYNNSIFGGTIFAATDPFFPVLFHQLLGHKGYTNIIAWSKSSEIRFMKPGKTDLHFKISLTETDITECEQVLNTIGKYEKTYPIEIFDENGQLCVSVTSEVYVRNLNIERDLHLHTQI